MSVIIRLDNLPWNASSLDIRRYFYGLDIPDGGVHIVGGEQGTAFIVFTTDEDARQALMKSNGQIHNDTVKLYLSSRTEMQNIITSTRGTSIPIHEVFTNPSYVIKRGSMNSSPIPSRRPVQLGSQKQRDFLNEEDNSTGSYKNRNYSLSRPNDHAENPHVFQDTSLQRHRSDRPSPSADDRFFKGQRSHVYQGNRSFPFKEKGFGKERDFDSSLHKHIPDRFEEPGKEREVFVKPRSSNEEGKRFNSFGQHSEVLGFGKHQSIDSERSHDYHFVKSKSGSDANCSLNVRDDSKPLPSRQNFYGVHRTPMSDTKSAHDDFNTGHGYMKSDHLPVRLPHETERKLYKEKSPSFAEQRTYEQNSGKHSNDWVVHVSNLPTSFHYKDIRRVFGNSIIPQDGLKIINDMKGRRIGECYMRFAFEEGFLEALKCNGMVISGKPLLVQKSNAYEFELAIDSYFPSDTKSDRDRSRSPLEKESEGKFYGIGITIRNFDPGCHRIDDLLHWLHNPQPKGVSRLNFNDYELTGDGLFRACMRLPSQDVMKVVHRVNGKFWRGLKVLVHPILMKFFHEHGANPRWWTEFVSEEADENPGRGTGIMNNPVFGDAGEKKFYCVRLDGLPFSATPQAVKEFFKGLEIANNGIHIVYNRDNQASGIGFVEFITSTDCRRALGFNNKYMGRRYLIIKPVDKNEFLAEFESLQQQSDRFMDVPVDHGEDSYDPVLEVGFSEADVRLENLHFKVELKDILQFFSGHQPVLESIKLQYRNGQPTGNGLVTFPSVAEAQRAVKELNHKRLLGWPVDLSLA